MNKNMKRGTGRPERERETNREKGEEKSKSNCGLGQMFIILFFFKNYQIDTIFALRLESKAASEIFPSGRE